MSRLTRSSKRQLTGLTIEEISFVDQPAVPKAKFLIAKRKEEEPSMEAIEKRTAMNGYTSSATGATTAAHIHEYACYLNRETGQIEGYVYGIGDHTHRITPESLARGETEESDGHTHELMTVKAARLLLAAGQEIAAEKAKGSPAVTLDMLKAGLDQVQTTVAALDKRIPVPPMPEGPALTADEEAALNTIRARLEGAARS